MTKIWTREESKERFPKPVSPLGWSLLKVPTQATLQQMSKVLGVKPYEMSDLTLWHNYHVYSRKDFFKDLRNLKFRFPRILQILGFVVVSFFGSVAFLFDGTFKVRFTQSLVLKMFGSSIEELCLHWPSRLAALKDLMGRDYLQSLSRDGDINAEKFILVKDHMQEDSRHFFAEDFNVYFLKTLVFGLLKSQLQSAGLNAEQASQLLQEVSLGIQGNFSLTMISDFQDLGVSQETLKSKYGHLTENWDLYAGTLLQQPSIWENRKKLAAKVALSHQPAEKSLKAFEEIRDLLSWNSLAAKWIEQYQKLIIVDEDLRAYSSLQYPQAIRLMDEVTKSKAFAKSGMSSEKIYFLFLREIEEGLAVGDFSKFVQPASERKSQYEKSLLSEPPMYLKEIQGQISEDKSLAAVKAKSEVLSGLKVSAGVFEGKVVLVKGYEDLNRVDKNTVIVIASATPVFSPFYAQCGAIVSETGGPLSHGAIVARECAVPMLTEVANAMTLLRDDQVVTVDANQGIIRVVHGK